MPLVWGRQVGKWESQASEGWVRKVLAEGQAPVVCKGNEGPAVKEDKAEVPAAVKSGGMRRVAIIEVRERLEIQRSRGGRWVWV